MSYSIPNTWSLEKIRAYVVKVTGALVALNELGKLKLEGMEPLCGSWLPQLVEQWRKEQAAVVKARDARDAARDLVVERNAVVAVYDMQWDATVGQMSSLAFLLAKSRANQDPYKTLFGSVKATALQKLGPAKATVAARRLVEKVRALLDKELLPLADTLERQSELLAAASESDVQAETALLGHAVSRVKLIRHLEMVIATTEVELLTRFPGRSDLVRAVLDPVTEKRRTKNADETAFDEEDAPEEPQAEVG